MLDRGAIAGEDGALLAQQRRAGSRAQEFGVGGLGSDGADAVVPGGHFDAVLGKCCVDATRLKVGINQEHADVLRVRRVLDHHRYAVEEAHADHCPYEVRGVDAQLGGHDWVDRAAHEFDHAGAGRRALLLRPRGERQEFGERLQARTLQHRGARALARLHEPFGTQRCDGLTHGAAGEPGRLHQRGVAGQGVARQELAARDRVAQGGGEAHMCRDTLVHLSIALRHGLHHVVSRPLDMTRHVCDLDQNVSRQVSP